MGSKFSKIVIKLKVICLCARKFATVSILQTFWGLKIRYLKPNYFSSILSLAILVSCNWIAKIK